MSKPINSGLYRTWLTERRSLTRRLQLASKKFEVEPLRFYHGRALPEEAPVLKLRPWQKAMIREVYLRCHDRPVVFAHSVLPCHSLRGHWQILSRLGSKPLGAALFSDPRVKRTPLAYKKLNTGHALYRKAVEGTATVPPELWARRSVFYLCNSAILVTEVFLPRVLTL
ncbi:MAG TPA: chorismate lyase [Methylophilaceae bacterium]|nr:chorismate lyase [Methylophilaceae bacterium]